MKAIIIIIISLLFTGCANLFYGGSMCLTDSDGNIIRAYNEFNSTNQNSSDIIISQPDFVYFLSKK